MTTAPITEGDTTSPPQDTATKIQSKRVLLVTRILFYVLLAASILFTLQLFFTGLTFYGNQADQHLSGTIATLYPYLIMLTRLVAKTVFMAVGTIIFLRKRDDRIGFMVSVFLVAFGAGGVYYAQYTPEPTPYAIENSLTWGWVSIGGMAWATLFSFFYLFPDGRFVPRWAIVGLMFSFVFVVLWTMPSSSSLYPGNWTGLLLFVTIVPSLILPLAAQVYRYRQVSTLVQRQQTKWVIIGFAVAVFAGIVTYVSAGIFTETFARGTIAYDVNSLFADVGWVAMPVALALAMLRYRLWDVDLLINRSLAYAVVAGTGILVFFSITLGLQLAIGQTQPLIALIIASGFSAAIFRPLHGFTQHMVDRHIYHLRFQVDDLRAAQHRQQITNPGALSGKSLGSYQILDLLGQGGMGEVYKASDGTHTVAVKTLLTDRAHDPELIRRFQREGEAGLQLNHPNICNVREINESDGIAYIVMDYLNGQDLHDYLKQNTTVDVTTLREWMADLAGALNAAHAQGMVHRDIKPGNIMLVPRDDNETFRAVLMDFGITKLKDANTLTKTGAIGTIDYMAPEQIMSAREVDHRADIYALGIVAYEILVGKKPFDGGVAQVMFAHMQQPPPDPRAADEAIPRGVAKAIMQAMAKKPDQRFDSVEAFRTALQS